MPHPPHPRLLVHAREVEADIRELAEATVAEHLRYFGWREWSLTVATQSPEDLLRHGRARWRWGMSAADRSNLREEYVDTFNRRDTLAVDFLDTLAESFELSRPIDDALERVVD